MEGEVKGREFTFANGTVAILVHRREELLELRAGVFGAQTLHHKDELIKIDRTRVVPVDLLEGSTADLLRARLVVVFVIYERNVLPLFDGVGIEYLEIRNESGGDS